MYVQNTEDKTKVRELFEASIRRPHFSTRYLHLLSLFRGWRSTSVASVVVSSPCWPTWSATSSSTPTYGPTSATCASRVLSKNRLSRLTWSSTQTSSPTNARLVKFNLSWPRSFCHVVIVAVLITGATPPPSLWGSDQKTGNNVHLSLTNETIVVLHQDIFFQPCFETTQNTKTTDGRLTVFLSFKSQSAGSDFWLHVRRDGLRLSQERQNYYYPLFLLNSVWKGSHARVLPSL